MEMQYISYEVWTYSSNLFWRSVQIYKSVVRGTAWTKYRVQHLN
jgi:hypothetical protein